MGSTIVWDKAIFQIEIMDVELQRYQPYVQKNGGNTNEAFQTDDSGSTKVTIQLSIYIIILPCICITLIGFFENTVFISEIKNLCTINFHICKNIFGPSVTTSPWRNIIKTYLNCTYNKMFLDPANFIVTLYLTIQVICINITSKFPISKHRPYWRKFRT